MKKILFIIISITLLSGCVKITLNDSKTSTGTEITQSEIINNSGSTQAAENVLEEIENTTDEELSQALLDFLSQENIDYKTEIQKTLARYNDNFGPVLEYKHQVKAKEEEEEEEGSGSIQNSDDNQSSINEETQSDTEETNENETNDNQDESDEIIQDNNYSGEVIISDESTVEKEEVTKEDEIQEEFTTVTKIGKSGEYISYTPNGSQCNGGLEMTDNQGNSKWLFYNSCDKIIYDFELDFGGINIFYKEPNGTPGELFVTIE